MVYHGGPLRRITATIAAKARNAATATGSTRDIATHSEIIVTIISKMFE